MWEIISRYWAHNLLIPAESNTIFSWISDCCICKENWKYCFCLWCCGKSIIVRWFLDIRQHIEKCYPLSPKIISLCFWCWKYLFEVGISLGNTSSYLWYLNKLLCWRHLRYLPKYSPSIFRICNTWMLVTVVVNSAPLFVREAHLERMILGGRVEFCDISTRLMSRYL